MMPCWYFEKKEIKNSPSYLEGIDVNTEAKYRRDGARFIIDAGTKLGLRYDTCATGVVYFHRFYMFHSFKEFPRYVTAACCLFLAGKVEETPKKCKDIIKIATDILTPQQFAAFGNDPREEVMTLERILLKTVKFDFQVEHPYALLVKFAKNIKGDKEKVQKLVQMAWTFINDSLCTTLSLQWEPEIIAVSLMYLGTRLNKFDVHDWSGKLPGTKQKWWESFVEDLTVDLMEDVCHQVLDLYSPANQQRDSGESPPPPPPVIPPNAGRTPNSQGSGDRKRSLPSTPSDPNTPGSQSSKAMKIESVPHMKKTTPQKVPPDKGRQPPPTSRPNQPPLQGEKIQSVTGQKAAPSSGGASYSQPPLTSSVQSYPAQADTPQYSTADPAAFSGYNPYMSTNMYSSSFMSQEGSQTLQTVMGTQAPVSTTTPQYGAYSQTQPPPAPAGAPPYGVPGPTQYITPGYQQQPGVYPTGTPGHPPPQGGPPAPAPTQPQYPPPGPQQQYPGATYPTYAQAAPGATAGYPNLAQPPPLMSQTYDQPAQPPNYHTTGAYPGPPRGPRPPHSQPPKQHQPTSALTTVRITGR